MISPDGPVLYGFTLGLVGAVNPCGFPLLPAYLMVSAAEADSTPLSSRFVRALGAGLAVTVGFVVVFGVLSAAIKVGVTVAVGWVPWVMIPLGVGCVLVGAATALSRGLPLHPSARKIFADRRRPLALAGFGVAYAVASLSCALPVFLAGVVGSFTQRGVGVGIASGLAYALGMGLIITAVSLVGASARPVRARRLRAAQPVLQRVAGGVLAVVGAYLALYWVGDLVAPFAQPGPVRAVEGAQNTISTWLASSPRLVGVVIGATILAGLGAACIGGLRVDRQRRETPPSASDASVPSSPTGTVSAERAGTRP